MVGVGVGEEVGEGVLGKSVGFDVGVIDRGEGILAGGAQVRHLHR